MPRHLSFLLKIFYISLSFSLSRSLSLSLPLSHSLSLSVSLSDRWRGCARERVKERERGRERETERERGRGREKEREGEREKERGRERKREIHCGRAVSLSVSHSVSQSACVIIILIPIGVWLKVFNCQNKMPHIIFRNKGSRNLPDSRLPISNWLFMAYTKKLRYGIFYISFSFQQFLFQDKFCSNNQNCQINWYQNLSIIKLVILGKICQ